MEADWEEEEKYNLDTHPAMIYDWIKTTIRQTNFCKWMCENHRIIICDFLENLRLKCAERTTIINFVTDWLHHNTIVRY